MKHKLRQKHYLRFADDFIALSENRGDLQELLPEMRRFLSEQLKLELHPKKSNFAAS